MRIGIYNRHLTGVGGGEKHMLAIAETLSRHYSVDVLTHHVLDLNKAGTQLGLDLSQARLRPLEDRPDPELAPVTAEYDLFINASDGTFLPSLAPRSLLLVYFPTQLNATPWTRLKWHAGQRLRRALLLPRYAAGFYGPEKLGTMTVRWTRSRACLEIPAPPHANVVDCRLTLTADRHVAPVRFLVDSRQLAVCEVSTRHLTSVDLSLPVNGEDFVCLDIVTPADGGSSNESPKLGVAIADVEIADARYRLYQVVFQRWFQELGQRLNSLYPVLDLSHLNTYDVLCANSHFTQRWIRQYWRKDSVVFYPPVDVDQFQPLSKRQQILSVGRFFTTGHNKKHLYMIRAFRQMLSAGLRDWELHLAGGTSLGSGNAEYVAQVKAEAAGAPIHVHTDVPFNFLRRLFGESAIYWHSAGYGEDPERHPLRYEHFGLTTVEAMAAGAVPVVIDGGGQSEIVNHGDDGFLWASTDDLKLYTRRLIEDAELRRRTAEAARKRSHAFARDIFETRLQALVGAWIPTPGE